jgi:hypothetical protein
LNGRPYLLGITKGDSVSGSAYIRRIEDEGLGWAGKEELYEEEKWPSNYVPTAITTFQLREHPYFFVLKAKRLFRESDKAAIYRINDDARGWRLAWEGKWDSDYVAVRSFQIQGHPYLFCLAENDTAYIRRINDDGKGWTTTHAGRWSSDHVGTAITGFELNGRSYIFALNKNRDAVIRRINGGGKGWEDVHTGKWSDQGCVAVQSFELDGRPHLFGLQSNHIATIRRINDDGRGWTTLFEGKWSSDCVGTAVTPFTVNGQPHVFTLQRPDTDRVAPKALALAKRVAGLVPSHGVEGAAKEVERILADEEWVEVLRGSDREIRLASEGRITRLRKPETVRMDLSDHYPVMVKFQVTR